MKILSTLRKQDSPSGRITALAGCIAVLLGFGSASTVLAAPHVLDDGPGDGSVVVGVDGYGSFGSATGGETTNAVYDPVGAGTPAGTSFESWIALRFGGAGARTMISTETIGSNPTVTGNNLAGASSFDQGPLHFELQQTLIPLFDNLNVQTGSQLQQTYVITNTGAAASSFELVRYLDGDLLFDGSLTDGGGRFFSGPTEILFETDSATGSNAATTFVGITAEGGTIPAVGRYEIDSYSGLRGRILSGTALDDTVTNDGGDADQFIDAGSGYDVTLALNNLFSLAPGGSATYVTSTFFGSGAPELVPVIPEPATCLFGLALTGVCFTRRARRQVA